MKKYLIILLSISATIFTSCEDSDKNPLVQGDVAPFVKFEVGNAQLNLADPDSALSGTFFSEVPELIASHEVFVGIDDGVNSPIFAPLQLITELPFEFSATLTEISAAIGIDPAVVLPGTVIIFENVTTAVNGVTVDSDDVTVNGETVSVAQQQGYIFNGVAICPPFDISEITGTYDVLVNGLAPGLGLTDPDPVREVIAGPGENQITIVGGSVGFAGGEDLIIDVDTQTGVLTLGLNEMGSPGLAFPDTIIGFASDYDVFPPGAIVISCIENPTISLGVALTCCAFVGDFQLVKQ